MQLLRRVGYKDLRAHRKEVRRMGGRWPPYWPLVIALATGLEVWEYSDMRGPLDGDGGYAVVSPTTGEIYSRVPIWLS